MFPPPRVEFDPEHRLVRSAYYHPESPWLGADRHWLECHRGKLWLLCPRRPPTKWGTSAFCALTRGSWKGGEEILQLRFWDDRRAIYLAAWQCNRLPGWKAGQRCWRIYVCSGENGEVRLEFWRTVFWREGPLPCTESWRGPRPDTGGPIVMTKDENDEFWRWVLEAGSHYANRRPRPYRSDEWVLSKLRGRR